MKTEGIKQSKFNIQYPNGENRLIMASNNNTVVTFAYDYMGRRFRKTVYDISDLSSPTSDFRYVYDGWNLIAEKSSELSVQSSSFYTWGLDLSGSLQGAGGVGGLLSVTECSVGSTNQYFPMADGNGNITEYVTTNGTIAAHYEYNPFGGIIASSGTKANDFHFRFSTKYLDDETDLYNYGKRDLDVELGRWISRDPIEEKGGLNVYAFVGNDGVGRVDLLGRSVTITQVGKYFFPKEHWLPNSWSDSHIAIYFIKRWSHYSKPGGVVHLSSKAVERIRRRGFYKTQIDFYVGNLKMKCGHGKRYVEHSESGSGGYGEAWYLGAHRYNLKMKGDCCRKHLYIILKIYDTFDFDFNDPVTNANWSKKFSSMVWGSILSMGDGMFYHTPFSVNGQYNEWIKSW